MEKMKTALAFGADAVYAGIPDFSLRVRINDFTMESLAEAVEYCHARNKLLYVTVNIFAHNRHLEKLDAHVEELKKIEVDALIVSDPGTMVRIRKVWPDCEIHLSTQANCTNYESARFWSDQGVHRIILGREVTLDEIRKIHKECPDLELEYFVHGAMCMAYSGRCFLSKHFFDRSANLGDCVQPCRWKYYITEEKRENEPLEIVEEEHGSYILNAHDLCLIKHIKELKDAGVRSFKIEGRAKSVYYQAVAAGAYSRVIRNIERITQKEIDYYFNELDTKLVHRGYSTGFLLGDTPGQNTTKNHEACNWEFCGQSLGHDGTHVLLKAHNTIKAGDEIEIVRPEYDIMNMEVGEMLDPDTKEPLDEAHGGQDRKVLLRVEGEVPEHSVIRRKI